MIEWCHQSPNDELLFNDVVDGSAVGVRLNVLTGARQVYMRPFAAAGGEGTNAASVNLGRIARLVPGEGAAGVPDHFADESAPEEDGLFVIGLTHDLQRLLVSIASVAADARERHAELRRRDFWFDHVSFNPTGKRLLFTVFAGGRNARPDSAFWTIGIDGAGLREVVPFGRGATRGAWLDAGSCIATFRGEDGFLAPRVFADSAETGEAACAGNISGPVRVIPSHDGNRLAIESENSRRRLKILTVFERTKGVARTLGELGVADDALFQGPGRCDMNPRWNHAGSALCVDAVGIEGTRQLHIVPAERNTSKPGR